MSTDDDLSPQGPGALRKAAGGIAFVTISNPGVRNALDDRARKQLLHDVSAAAASLSTVVVLRGEGGTFCSGADLRSLHTDDPAYLTGRLSEMQEIVRTVRQASQVFIAAVDGFAVGSGLALAASCDLIVAASDATFGATFGRVGLTGDSGIFWTLPERIGLARARRLLLLAEVIDAEEAGSIGLVDAVTGADQVHAIALEWATRDRGSLASRGAGYQVPIQPK